MMHTSCPSGKSESVTYGCDIDGVQKHVEHESSFNTDQFYRAGTIAAVVSFFLSFFLIWSII